MSRPARIAATAAVIGGLVVSPAHGSTRAPLASRAKPAIADVYPVPAARGLMVTSGGWAYCEQVRALARTSRYALLCGRYAEDGYLHAGLRSRRHLDWGNPQYLAALAAEVAAAHRRIGGELIFLGVSYSGFGVATLASHHPELRPDALIVIDSYFDLVARRAKLPDTHETAVEIDGEVGRSQEELQRRSAGVPGLAELARHGTRLTVVWSISDDERRFFNGATCDRSANAQTLSRLAVTLRRPIVAWVTEARHGHDLWNHGKNIVRGHPPGREVTFRPDGKVPSDAVCGGP